MPELTEAEKALWAIHAYAQTAYAECAMIDKRGCKHLNEVRNMVRRHFKASDALAQLRAGGAPAEPQEGA